MEEKYNLNKFDGYDKLITDLRTYEFIKYLK